MWWRRRQEDSPDDAELRELLKEYSRVHGYRAEKSNESTESSDGPGTVKTGVKTTAELSLDEVIKGKLFDYTQREAIIYSDEEPCDTWRHLDVCGPLF